MCKENITKMESDDTSDQVSPGKTLLGNWVEERQVAGLDYNSKSIKEKHVGGHPNLLTHKKDSCNYVTTCDASFQEPELQSAKKTGKRRELLEKELYEKISCGMQETFQPRVPPIDYTSTTKGDFSKDFKETIIQPTMEHDVIREQPITFWKQNLESIDGVTKAKYENSPFKKNAAFSTPIEETFDAQKPGEEWLY